MKIVEYVAAFYEKREPARAEFTSVEQMLALPWVAKHRVHRGFIRFSIANGDTLIVEFHDRSRPSIKVVGRISELDAGLLSELPVWQPA